MRNTTLKLRLALVIVCGLAVWVAAFYAFTTRAHAQMLDSHAHVQGYTTADPNNEFGFGLATPDGRFAITPVYGCEWLGVDAEVFVWTNAAVPPWLGLSGTDATEPGCFVQVDGKRDNTPCFTDQQNGLCDVRQEED